MLKMLKWSPIFLLITIITAIFGFSGIIENGVGIAKLLFYVSLILFVMSLITVRRSI